MCQLFQPTVTMAAATSTYVRGESDIFEYLTSTLKERIMIIDGAMGTMIQVCDTTLTQGLHFPHLRTSGRHDAASQKHKLGEAEYRGERFADYSMDVKGNNDLLSLTQVRALTCGAWPLHLCTSHCRLHCAARHHLQHPQAVPGGRS